MLLPVGFIGAIVPNGLVLPVLSVLSDGLVPPILLMGLFSPFSQGEQKEATKVKHTAMDKTLPTREAATGE